MDVLRISDLNDPVITDNRQKAILWFADIPSDPLVSVRFAPYAILNSFCGKRPGVCDFIRLLPLLDWVERVPPVIQESIELGNRLAVLEVDAENPRNIGWTYCFLRRLAGIHSQPNNNHLDRQNIIIGPVPVWRIEDTPKISERTIAWSDKFISSEEFCGVDGQYPMFMVEILKTFELLMPYEDLFKNDSFCAQQLLFLILIPFQPLWDTVRNRKYPIGMHDQNNAYWETFLRLWDNRFAIAYRHLQKRLEIKYTPDPQRSYWKELLEVIETNLCEKELRSLISGLYGWSVSQYEYVFDDKISSPFRTFMNNFEALSRKINYDYNDYACNPSWHESNQGLGYGNIYEMMGTQHFGFTYGDYFNERVIEPPDSATTRDQIRRIDDLTDNELIELPAGEIAMMDSTPDGYAISFAMRVGKGWVIVVPAKTKQACVTALAERLFTLKYSSILISKSGIVQSEANLDKLHEDIQAIRQNTSLLPDAVTKLQAEVETARLNTKAIDEKSTETLQHLKDMKPHVLGIPQLQSDLVEARVAPEDMALEIQKRIASILTLEEQRIWIAVCKEGSQKAALESLRQYGIKSAATLSRRVKIIDEKLKKNGLSPCNSLGPESTYRMSGGGRNDNGKVVPQEISMIVRDWTKDKFERDRTIQSYLAASAEDKAEFHLSYPGIENETEKFRNRRLKSD